MRLRAPELAQMNFDCTPSSLNWIRFQGLTGLWRRNVADGSNQTKVVTKTIVSPVANFCNYCAKQSLPQFSEAQNPTLF